MRLQFITEAKEQLDLVDLPYDIAALQPVMGRDSVKYHYDVLSRGYVEKFNNNEGDPDFNRAGAFLHNLWWPQLVTPKVNNQPKGVSLTLIENNYNSYADFKDEFIDTALKLQGSGWVYLAKNGLIKTIHNHAVKNDIVMIIDVWEHAYYLDYPADRKSYMRSIWRCINWNVVNDRINLNA
jgi:Fe-Mn family superoxide dismutase